MGVVKTTHKRRLKMGDRLFKDNMKIPVLKVC